MNERPFRGLCENRDLTLYIRLMFTPMKSGVRTGVSLLLPLATMLSPEGCFVPLTPREELSRETAGHRLPIDQLAAELINRRHPQRDWEPEHPVRGEIQQAGGRSALALLALLEIGQSLQEPGLDEALERVARSQNDGTYALSLRIMLFARLPEKWRPVLERDVGTLLGGFSMTVNGWGYRPDPDGKRIDNSTTQFAALALRDAAHRGIQVPDELWLRLEHRFLESQLPDGSWDYSGNGKPRASMTAAAVATLAIVRERVHRSEYDDGPSRRVRRLEDAIARGLDWLDDRFDPKRNHGHQGHLPYYLFAIERAAQATGRRRFKALDWLQEGTRVLLQRACRTSSNGELIVRSGTSPSTPDLALTLLFLHRGLLTNAVGEVDADGGDRRPVAVAAMTEQLAARIETRLGWIRIDTTREPLEEHHRWPPMLWLDLKGRQDRFEEPTDPANCRLLKAVREGHLLVCSVDGGRGSVRSLARKLAEALPGTNICPMTRAHPLVQKPWEVSAVPPAFELNNGVRPLVILVGGDPAGRLQEGHREAKRIMDLLANLCVHAHAGDFKTSGRWRVRTTKQPERIHTRPLLNLAPAGRTLIEPNALACVAARLERLHGMEIDVRTGQLEEEPVGKETTAIIISGLQAWTPSIEEWARIDEWLGAGVPVLIETTGGRGDFTASFIAAATSRYGTAIEPVAWNEPLFAETHPGDLDMTRTGWTTESIRRFGVGPHGHRLETIPTEHTGRLLVASFDLTHAMLDSPVNGVHGWQTLWVDSLLRRLLRWRHPEPEGVVPRPETDEPRDDDALPGDDGQDSPVVRTESPRSH
jgi:hypothetical protein